MLETKNGAHTQTDQKERAWKKEQEGELENIKKAEWVKQKEYDWCDKTVVLYESARETKECIRQRSACPLAYLLVNNIIDAVLQIVSNDGLVGEECIH